MPPRIDLYDQRLTPQSRATPYIRPVDTGAEAIGRGIGQIGQGLDALATATRLREEDDARVYVSSAMARARAQASEMRRNAFREAQDGWRGATEKVSQGWGLLRENAVADAPTDAAKRFLTQAFDAYQPLMLEEVAGEEETARRGWRADSFREAFRTEGSAIAADPALYDQAAAQQRELIRGLTDLDANDKRDLLAAMEEEFATSAVAALVGRDPTAALRALNDPEATGPYAYLSGAQRGIFRNQAERELKAREAEWRAQVAESAAFAMQNWELGLPSANAPSLATVRAARGEEFALRYEAAQAASMEGAALALRPSSELQAIVADAAGRPDVREAFLHEAQRRAAAQILESRATDPMDFQMRNRLGGGGDILAAFSGRNYDEVDSILRTRRAAAETNGRDMGLAPAPLTRNEAAALSGAIRAMPSQDRARMLERWSGAMGGDTPAYRALLSQVFPDSPAEAYAGFITAHAGVNVDGAAEARLILRGAAILRGAGDGEEGGRASTRTFDMPSETMLRQRWRLRVGEAYPSPEAEEQAYQVFRAHYAGASEAGGVAYDGQTAMLNPDRADRAVAIATGGVVNWAGRPTLVPFGMSASQFEAGVRRAFAGHSALDGEDPADYTLRPAGGGRYYVMQGEAAARDAAGLPVVISVSRAPR